jgi:hypothetical protein
MIYFCHVPIQKIQLIWFIITEKIVHQKYKNYTINIENLHTNMNIKDKELNVSEKNNYLVKDWINLFYYSRILIVNMLLASYSFLLDFFVRFVKIFS